MRRARHDPERLQRRFTRRALVLGGAQALVVGGLATRMHFLQVDQAERFRLLAEENRINIRLIAPSRGEIFDRTGQVLAANVPSYRIVMVREDTRDVDAVLKTLAELVDIDQSDLDRARAELAKSPPFLPVTVAENATWDEVSRVSVNAPSLPGISAEVGLTRAYPLGSDFAHVVGYVGPISDYDLQRIENPDQLLQIPRFQLGKAGVESKAEDSLRGKAGAKQVEVNARGRVMRELGRRSGVAGADLQITVDASLQNYVQARLGNQSASAVVMDLSNGDLVAIASSPTFDPNLFVRGISSKAYSALIENPYRPLAAKCVQGAYPPGSTFKMITAMAALEAGIVVPDETVYCPGHLEVSGRRFHCWRSGGHGWVDLKESLKKSCDVYYYDLALKVGIERITEMGRLFGLGERHDVPLSAVSRGLMPTRAWKFRQHGRPWVLGDTVNASIGQGDVLCSPLQLTVMTARLATGRSIRPRLIKSINGIEQPSRGGTPLPINRNNLLRMQRAMYAVVNDKRGTAHGSRIVAEGIRMAGKTGTSQVRNITAAERRTGVVRNEDLPWERRDHALFVNYAPFDNPRYAVAVVVEHGGGGSTAAAPIARDITLQALYQGAPPLEAYPERDRPQIEELQRSLRDVRPVANYVSEDRA